MTWRGIRQALNNGLRCVSLNRSNMVSFMSISLVPGAFYFFIYRFAMKHGDAFYTVGRGRCKLIPMSKPPGCSA